MENVNNNHPIAASMHSLRSSKQALIMQPDIETAKSEALPSIYLRPEQLLRQRRHDDPRVSQPH